MDILEFIEDFRKKNWEYFFLNWGCYIFARILQVRYWGVIYSNIDHCILRKGSEYFDIKGLRTHALILDLRYHPIDELEDSRYRAYSNFNN